MLDLTLCNELLSGEGHDLPAQARIVCELGYMGLELDPSTLGPLPHKFSPDVVADIRQRVEGEGVQITGLHWLISGYPETSVTDPARQADTAEILLGLIDLCAALGGAVLVHGSPKQRMRPDGMADDSLYDRLTQFFKPIASHAAERGVVYCIEPLSTAETDVITSVSEAADLVRAVDNPAFRTMIDCSAAGQVEPPVADLIRKWVPTGMIGHIHANDTNRGAPGMGDDPFPDIVAALIESGWNKPIGVEPFRCLIDATTTAATGIATLRACERAAS